jgi:hypothetical protein
MKHKRRNLAARCLSLALLLFVFSSTAFAVVSLPEYRDKIHQAKESLDVLLYSDEEDSNLAENQNYEIEALKKIRENFSASETVEWQGTSVEVENAWILDKLKAFEGEKDSTKQAAILNELSDRLGAIEIKLNELEQATSWKRTKDEDKQKLAEILRRAEYQKPEEKQESFLQKKWREFQKWLADIFPRPKMGEPSAKGFQSFSYVLQFIIFGLVLGIIGFLIYRFAPFLFARFKGREKKDKGVRVILGERLAADDTSGNLFSEAEKLAREGNLRAAIRKGYIALLCELSDRKLIGLAHHKTNRDYLRDIRSLPKLYQNMNSLTGSFERHWYGFTSPEEKDWEEFRQKYKRAVSGEQ